MIKLSVLLCSCIVRTKKQVKPVGTTSKLTTFQSVGAWSEVTGTKTTQLLCPVSEIFHMLGCLGLTLGGLGGLSYSSLICYLIIKMCVTSLPEHRAGLAEQGPVNPHSGLNRRTSAWAVESRFPPPPVLWMSCCGPASSLPNQYTCSITKYIKMNRHSVLQRCY